MNIEISSEKDIFTMKLFHYFMTKRDYAPIIIRGIDNEIWLENPKEYFRVVRIVTKTVFNNDQYEYDVLKVNNIIKQIKRRTFNPFMRVLTIYLNTGDNFSNNSSDKFHYIVLSSEEEFYKEELIKKYYSDIKENMNYKEDGFNLLGKITSEISEKNVKENERYNNMMKIRKPYITYALVLINLIVFALMYILGNGSEDSLTLVKFGANYGPLVRAGEYYRLITSAFLHIGIFHLLCNMYALLLIGPNIENFYGKFKFLFIYLFSAIMGSLFALVLEGDKLSAGASGAIFGLLASLLYFGYNYRGYIGNSIINQVIPVILLNLLIGFITPGISNAAHIGGLIGGVAISFMLGFDKNEEKSKRIHGFIITTILTAFMIYLAFFK